VVNGEPGRATVRDNKVVDEVAPLRPGKAVHQQQVPEVAGEHCRIRHQRHEETTGRDLDLNSHPRAGLAGRISNGPEGELTSAFGDENPALGSVNQLDKY